MKPKPCIICDKPLESVDIDWKNMQPHNGGEVKFIFSYGSTKFDDCFGSTVFRGVICDDCAEKLVSKMEKQECSS